MRTRKTVLAQVMAVVENIQDSNDRFTVIDSGENHCGILGLVGGLEETEDPWFHLIWQGVDEADAGNKPQLIALDGVGAIVGLYNELGHLLNRYHSLKAEKDAKGTREILDTT